MVVPFWPTQVWYPTMLKILVPTQISLNSRKSLLVLRQTLNQVHPMCKNVSMSNLHDQLCQAL